MPHRYATRRTLVRGSAVAGGGGAYTAQGVTFHGISDFMTVSALTGMAAGQKGIISFWFKINGGNASFQIMLETRDTTSFEFYRSNTNKWHLGLANSASTALLTWDSTGTYTSSMTGWAHFLGSWDLSIPAASFWITDVADAVPATLTIGTINYLPTSTAWDFGARSGGTLLLNADIADFYFNSAEYLDFAAGAGVGTANRRKFISAGLAPVDLGATGSLPTGTAPIVYQRGAVASWHTNKNTTAGGWTLTGALTASATNPP